MLSNPEAELTLIGEMICFPEIVAEVSAEISSEDFTTLELRYLYEAFLSLFAGGRKIDPLLVVEETKLEKAAAKDLLYKASQRAISSESRHIHMELIKKASRLRKTRERARQLISMIDETEDIELSRAAAENVLKAFDGLDSDSTTSAADGFERFLETAGKKREYIKFNIREIDCFVKMSPGDFVVLGGRPSTGKTAMTLQMMLNMSDKYRVVYFSLETSAVKLFERMVSNWTMKSFTKIKNGALTDRDYREIEAFGGKKFRGSSFWVVEAAGWTVEKIKSKAMQLKADVIFVDYLGLVDASGKSLYEKISDISVKLQRLAHTTGIAVVALAQLNRATNGAPDMTSLRDSGQIEQDADVIMLLWTPKDTPQERENKQLVIAKNKEGEIGIVDFKFSGDIQRFIPVIRDNSRRTPARKSAVWQEDDNDEILEV